MILYSRVVIFLFFALLFVPKSYASGIIKNDIQIRNDLAWLLDRGVINISLTTWPLSQEEIINSLKKAKPSQRAEQIVIARIKNQLKILKPDLSISSYKSSNKQVRTQEFGQTKSSSSIITFSVNESSDWWETNYQFNIECREGIKNGSRFNANGAYAAVNFYNQWISFGQVPQWWGPGYEGSLIRGDSSRPMTGFLVQRDKQSPPEAKWLSWIGPWQYQISTSQVNQYTSVPHAKILGGRFTSLPIPALEFGVSRVLQWGGEGRPESFESFWNGFIGKDNMSEYNPNEPGNQLAGFDFKLRLAHLIDWPVSIYGQIIGEDESGYFPSSNMYIGGFELHEVIGDNALNWYIEVHDTRTNLSEKNISYNHHIYNDGYYQQGYPLGDSIGGDGQLVATKLEFVTENNNRWSSRLMYAKVNDDNQDFNFAHPKKDTLKYVNIGWHGYIFYPAQITTLLWYENTIYHDEFGFNLQLDLALFL